MIPAMTTRMPADMTTTRPIFCLRGSCNLMMQGMVKMIIQVSETPLNTALAYRRGRNGTHVMLGLKKNLPDSGLHATPLEIRRGIEKHTTKPIVAHAMNRYLPLGKMRR
jgi:hypothetical protein